MKQKELRQNYLGARGWVWAGNYKTERYLYLLHRITALGLMLFIEGLKLGLFPIGETLAYALAKKGSLLWLLLFSFALGFSTTIAEPALIAVANEASEISSKAGLIEDSINVRKRFFVKGQVYEV